MNAVPLSDVLEAAAYALVSERCRRAYLHDMRGGLQALHNALELLARSAKTPGANPQLVEKSTALARRAMSTLEKSLTEIVQRMTPRDEPAASINVGDLVGEVLRFLGSDASSRSITFHSAAVPDLCIVAQPNKCRLLILGLCATTIDQLAPGAVLHIAVGRAACDALIEFKADIPYAAMRSPQDFWRCAPTTLAPYELLLALTRRWVSENGGRVELLSGSHLLNALQIYYPIAPS